LEAFSQMLHHLPIDSGMGFVLVPHLDPDHASTLVDILSRTTSLPVVEISPGQRVEPDHVYVLPPGSAVSIEQGVLKLRKRSKIRVPHRPIDSFFESLSQDQGELAIGVVLSGTASDGTLGLESIKAEGGITFAQDDSAKHSSMPRSAVAAGCVDLVLSPAQIAEELARIAKHPQIVRQDTRASSGETRGNVDSPPIRDGASPATSDGHSFARRSNGDADNATHTGAANDETEGGEVEEAYHEILSLLHQSSGVDFSLYKPSTIRRRINRRMILTKHVTLAEYSAFVRDLSSERELLYSDVLINVTSFFRNPDMFDALRLKILPELMERRGNDPIRCWVLGCSTGQEAYSLAISFAEAAGESNRRPDVQIFATDVNDTLLVRARHGLYPKTIADDVSPERLRRFFVEEQGGYRVGKSVRETVVFARHDLISDPPFSRMDLISCRNVLIYLEPSVQRRAIPTFHYSLKPDGLLVLGASESVGRYTDLFSGGARKYKIFTRKPGPTRALHLPIAGAGSRSRHVQNGDSNPDQQPTSRASRNGELDAQREADRVTITRYGPPGVVIDNALQILQFRGATKAFLEPPTGKATFDVLKMAKDGLMLPLRRTINQARQTNATAHRENVRVQSDDIARTVNLEVIPLGNREERCF
jgi:two-component system CheB/CheR fusion protein